MRLTKIAVAIGVTGMVSMAGPAWAAAPGPYDVAVGTDTSGTVYYFSAEDSDGIAFTAFNVASGTPRVMTCDSATAVGEIETGSGVDGNIATITDTTWTDCVGVGQNLCVTGNHPWSLNVDDLTVTPALTDTVTGNIDNVDATVEDCGTGGVVCSFDVVGSADGEFEEATQVLHVDETGFSGELSIASANCGGVLDAGDPADFVGDYEVEIFEDEAKTIPASELNISLTP